MSVSVHDQNRIFRQPNFTKWLYYKLFDDDDASKRYQNALKTQKIVLLDAKISPINKNIPIFPMSIAIAIIGKAINIAIFFRNTIFISIKFDPKIPYFIEKYQFIENINIFGLNPEISP